MALSSAAASALGSTIASTLTGLSDADKENPEKIWQEVCKAIYAALKTDAVVTGITTVPPGPNPPAPFNLASGALT
jgi:hypothetical protein